MIRIRAKIYKPRTPFFILSPLAGDPGSSHDAAVGPDVLRDAGAPAGTGLGPGPFFSSFLFFQNGYGHRSVGFAFTGPPTSKIIVTTVSEKPA